MTGPPRGGRKEEEECYVLERTMDGEQGSCIEEIMGVIGRLCAAVGVATVNILLLGTSGTFTLSVLEGTSLYNT